MVRETKKFDRERRVQPTCLPIVQSLKETLGASWHWQVGISPATGFCHRPL